MRCSDVATEEIVKLHRQYGMRRTRRESPHAARAWTGRERAHTLGTCLGSGVDIRDERMRAGLCFVLTTVLCAA